MRQLASFVVLGWMCLTGVGSLADEPAKASPKSPPVEDGGDPSEAERKRRSEFMKADLDRYTIVADDRRETPLSITTEPVLRFTNPVRNSLTDGTVFLWLEGERPLAAAVLSIRDKGNTFREFVTFTDRPLECRREGRIAWKPTSGNLVDQSLDDAAPPDSSDKRRLRQMRDVARRFRFIKKSTPDVDLRLMAQPIYRYTAESDAVIDGAVFALVEATDPDFFLVVEAHRGDAASAAEWRYTLARMCSGPLEVELDGRRLWSESGYWDNPRSPSDPYAEIYVGVYPLP